MLRTITHIPRALITAPKIHTDLLWDLSLLFVGLALLYFIFIFYFRNKITSKSKKIAQKKKDLSPIISEFLFFEEESSKDEKTNYIQLKIEIRQFLKDTFNRRILSEVLLDLSIDVSGKTQKSLFKLYKELDLHKDAYKKLESWRWEIVSKGILELTQMQVTESYGFITKRINDKRATIRKQAEIATVTLKNEGISYFLDTTRYKISEWQQLKILEVLRNKKDFNPPKFKQWLTSNNKYVVLFSLRLIKHYNQNDSELSIIELVKHKNTQIKQEAIQCIKDFGFKNAKDTLKLVFWNCSTDIKIEILSALSEIGQEEDLLFLNQIENKERNFYVKSKALSTINCIAPETVMPTNEIEQNIKHNTPKDIITPEQENVEEKQPEITNLENKPKSMDDTPITPNEIHEIRQQELVKAITTAEEAQQKPIENKENLDFLPIVTSAQNKNASKKPTTEKRTEDIVVNFQTVVAPNINNLPVVFSTVDAKKINLSTTLNLNFLPIVTSKKTKKITQEINPLLLEVNDYEVVKNTVLDAKENLELDFLPVVFDEIKENKEPNSILEIDDAYIKNIITEVDEVEISNQNTLDENQLEDAFEIDLSNLFFENNETVKEPDSENEFKIPKAIFYNQRDLKMLAHLEDLNELGDAREIPLLEEYLKKEKEASIRDRIIEILEKFYKENSITNSTNKEVVVNISDYSIIEELFTNCDTESKLILLDEILTVSSEKEVPFLIKLTKDEDSNVRKKAQQCLEQLQLKISTTKIEEEISVHEPIPLEFAFLEDYNAELHKNSIKPSKITNNQIEDGLAEQKKEPSFLEQFYSFSNKLFDKFNG